jgi:hypothetical protein
MLNLLEKNGFIEEVKETKKRWRAKKGEYYWYLEYHYSNAVGTSDEWESEIDNIRYLTGNYFKTKKEAEEYKNYLLADTKIKDWILENDEEGLDWENEDDYKYIIIYDYYNENLDYNSWFNSLKFSDYSVSSEELAKKLIKKCKEELLTVFKIK